MGFCLKGNFLEIGNDDRYCLFDLELILEKMVEKFNYFELKGVLILATAGGDDLSCLSTKVKIVDKFTASKRNLLAEMSGQLPSIFTSKEVKGALRIDIKKFDQSLPDYFFCFLVDAEGITNEQKNEIFSAGREALMKMLE